MHVKPPARRADARAPAAFACTAALTFASSSSDGRPVEAAVGGEAVEPVKSALAFRGSRGGH